MQPAVLVQAWRMAAKDLGIKIEVPYVLRLNGGEYVHADLLVRDFGRVLVATQAAEETFRRLGDQITAAGYGYSVFCGEESAYDRTQFIQILRDWGWQGATDRRPDWYNDEQGEAP